MTRNLLFAILTLVAALGLGSELGYYYFPSKISETLVAFFSLSYEANFPTWYASCLLFTCALVLGGICRSVCQKGAQRCFHWGLLSGIFFYLSLDEAVGIHEHLGGRLQLGGLFYFDWVVYAGMAVLLIGLIFIPFLRRLPRSTRNAFMVAGFIYITGALLMELPLGLWTEQHGDQNLTYALIDFVEEVLELIGISLFLMTLEKYFIRTEKPSPSS